LLVDTTLVHAVTNLLIVKGFKDAMSTGSQVVQSAGRRGVVDKRKA